MDKWNNTTEINCQNFDSKKFKHLLESQSLVDCTIACDGGKICAHKAVLSACSSYLAKILIDHPTDHPTIILPELGIEDVITLVYYMYTGELLHSSALNSTNLLKTAAILSVNSLSDVLGSSGQTSNQVNNISPSSNSSNTSSSISDSNSNNHQNNIKYGSIQHYFGSSNTRAVSNQTGRATNNKLEFQFKCPVCQNDFQTICSFEYHMQRVHNVSSFGCEICHKPFASLRYVLTDHMRRCHGLSPQKKSLS